PELIERAADYLLKEKKISGPLYAALTHLHDFPTLVGVDQEANYQANVEAYRASAGLTRAAKDRLADLESQLNERKKAFNPALAAFDARVVAFRTGNLRFADYIRFLSQRSDHVST